MGKKNKASKNGFYYFMCEIKNKMKLNSMEEASAAADPIWKAMSMQERQVYSSKAKQERNGAPVRLTAAHENLELLLRDEENALQKDAQMKEYIKNLLHSLSAENRLESEHFHVMHMNSFGFIQNINTHFPAEIGLAKFSLKDGVDVENVFHKIINPGKIPLGYAYSVKSTSASSHQLALPTDDGDSNLEEVLEGINAFMAVEGIYSFVDPATSSGGHYPPIFVRDSEMTLVNGVLNQLCHSYSVNRELFRVFSLQHFLFVLMNSLEDGTIYWPTINQSILALERDIYDYTPEISCKFHEENDLTVHCSKSIVIRTIFIICDNCCQHLNMEIIPGKHIPANSNVTTRCSTASSISGYQMNNNAPSVDGGSCASSSNYYSFNNDFQSGHSDIGDGWKEVSKKNDQRAQHNSNVSSSNGDWPPASVENAPFRPPSTSAKRPYQPLRRPTTLSAGVVAGSSSPSNGCIPKLGKGRGRNVTRQE